MVIQYNRHIRVKRCTLYLQLFVASCFRASVNIHAPNRTCPNQLKRPMDMSLLLYCFFSKRKGSRQNEGDSTLERPHLPSLRGDGCPGFDSYATTGYCRHCTAIACPSMYRYLLYLHHRSGGTNMYITTSFALGITCVVQCSVCSFDWRPTKLGKRLHPQGLASVVTQRR